MNYFLAKTDPHTYSIDQFERELRTIWDGVRNPQAVRAIREMRPGDRVFLYHSSAEPAVVGMAEVLNEPVPDPNDPKSAIVELRFRDRLNPATTLAEIKQSGRFADWSLIRQSRLSTMTAPESFVEWMRERYPGKEL